MNRFKIVISMKKVHLFLVSIILLSVSCRQPQSYSISAFHLLLQVTDSIIPDKDLEEFIRPYNDSLTSYLNRKIGVNEIELKSFKPDSPLSGLIADIMLEKGRELLLSVNESEYNLPSIAIINTGGVRAALKKGDVTIKNIYEILPFENVLVALLMTGEDMEDLFKHLARSHGDGLSGATCDFTTSGMENIMVNGEKFSKDKQYWVFAPDYLAAGGNRYVVFSKALKQIESDLKLREIVIEYINNLNDNNRPLCHIHNTRINDIRNIRNETK